MSDMVNKGLHPINNSMERLLKLLSGFEFEIRLNWQAWRNGCKVYQQVRITINLSGRLHYLIICNIIT